MKALVWMLLIALVYWWKTSAKEAKQMPPKRPRPEASKKMTRARAFTILQVSEMATPVEIKRAYQDLVAQYHPDRVAGAAPELQQLAERRTKELNLAYATLKDRSTSTS